MAQSRLTTGGGGRNRPVGRAGKQVRRSPVSSLAADHVVLFFLFGLEFKGLAPAYRVFAD